MDVNIVEIVELDNGGVEMKLDMDAEMLKFLVNYAFLDIFEKNLLKVKELYNE